MVLRVGKKGADVEGFSACAIQRAVDMLAVSGEDGTVELDAGEFLLDAPIRLCSGLTLTGQGSSTVLKKSRGTETVLRRDADYGEWLADVECVENFTEGMGVLISDDAHKDVREADVRRIVRIEADAHRIWLDRFLDRDYSATLHGTMSNTCSLLEGIDVENVTVRGLSLDGNASENQPISNCVGGAVFFERSRRIRLEDLLVMNFNGDGISVQTMEAVTIRGCVVTGCSGNGIHPGTGTYSLMLEDCVSSGNGWDGIFICWRVIGGVIRCNRCENNGRSGINIGHKDTDSLYERNLCRGNALYGIHLRPENEDNAPHRCRFSGNRCRGNGQGPIRIESPARNLVFEENDF